VCQLSFSHIDETPLCLFSSSCVFLQFLFYLSLVLHGVKTDNEFLYLVDVSCHTVYFFVAFFFKVLLLFLLYCAGEYFLSIPSCAQIGERLVVASIGFVHGG